MWSAKIHESFFTNPQSEVPSNRENTTSTQCYSFEKWTKVSQFSLKDIICIIHTGIIYLYLDFRSLQVETYSFHDVFPVIVGKIKTIILTLFMKISEKFQIWQVDQCLSFKCIQRHFLPGCTSEWIRVDV